MTRTILVTGSTGKQGRALIKALLATDHDFEILALTRNAAAPPAKSLLSSHTSAAANLKLVEGNLDEEATMRTIFDSAEPNGGIWGVFGLLAYPGLGAKAVREENQGKVRNKTSTCAQRRHLIYSWSCLPICA